MIEVTKHKRHNATYLQGVAGYVTGTPASELTIGSHIMWNGGGLSEVTAIHDLSPAYIAVDTIEDGKQYYGRKLKKSRIVARPLKEIK